MKRIKNLPKVIRVALAIFLCALLLCVISGALLFFGVIHINNPQAKGYSVTGVDVSAYQGKSTGKP